ncbi:MAG: DUF3794 domain-containing protein [Clostridia bacterium]
MAYEKIFTLGKKKYSGEVNVECSLGLESDEEILKVLSTNARATISLPQTTGNEVVYNGNVNVCLIFAGKDAKIGSTQSVCPFIFKQQIDSAENKIVYGKATISETKVESVTATGVKIVCTVLVETYVFSNGGIQVYVPEDESIISKLCEVSTYKVGTQQTSNMVETVELTAKYPIKKVLCSQNNVVIKNSVADNNIATISGEIQTNVVFIQDDETQKISNLSTTTPFRQEIEVASLKKEDKIEAYAKVIAEKEVQTINGNKLNIEIPLELFILPFESQEFTSVCDLFSLENEIKTTTESFENTTPLGSEYFEQKIEASLTLPENEPRVDKFLTSLGQKVKITSAYVNDGSLILEGVAETNVVYVNDEMDSIHSVLVEIPFVTQARTEMDDNAMVLCEPTLTDFEVMVKRGRDVFVDAKIKANCNFTKKEDDSVISKVELGDELATHDEAIQIYFGKAGEAIWDIAKHLKISPQIILEQNPSLSDPLEQDTKIVIYFQKK